MPDLLRTREACEFLRVTRAKFRRLRAEPDFPPEIVLGSRSLRWRRADLERFLAGRQRPEPEPAA